MLKSLYTLLVLFILALPGYAANSDNYYVELLVFTHINSAESTTAINPEYFIDKQAIQLNFVHKDTEHHPYTKLGFKQREFNYIKHLFDKDKNYSVLLHQKWQQPLQPEFNHPVILTDGTDNPSNTQQIEELTTLKEILTLQGKPKPHLKTENLFQLLFNPACNQTNSSLLPNYSSNSRISSLFINYPEQSDYKSGGIYIPNKLNGFVKLTSLNQELQLEIMLSWHSNPLASFELNEKVKLKPGVSYYLDSPTLGALVKISKVR